MRSFTALEGSRVRQERGIVTSFPVNRGPVPRLAAYADRTYPTTGTGVLKQPTAWGSFTTIQGNPLVAVDTVNVGGPALIRTGPNDALLTTAGAGAFLATGPSVVFFVMRMRRERQNANFRLLDGTVNGTKKGYQAQVGDEVSPTAYERIFGARVWDGATWLVDTPQSNQSFGHWIPQKLMVVGIRLTTTSIQIWRDGAFVWSSANGLSFAYPGADLTAPLALGNGYYDFAAFEAYDRGDTWTDAMMQGNSRTLAARFRVSMINVLAGDPLLLDNTKSAAFPYVELGATGKPVVQVFNGFDEVAATQSNDEFDAVDAGGRAYGPPIRQTTNTASVFWSDIKRSPVLSDGSIVEVTYQYLSTGGVPTPDLFSRRSTDGGVTWGAWITTSLGTTDLAVESAPVEDPNRAGHSHVAVFPQVSGASTKRSIYVMHSTNDGASWPTSTLVADGPTDAKDYAEPGACYLPDGSLYLLIRDNTHPGVSGMLQAVSADGQGTTWSALDTHGPPAWSAGQMARVGPSGAMYWLGRPTGNTNNAAVYTRPVGFAWNDPWNARIIVDPLQSLNYYGGYLPSAELLVWARGASDATKTNVVTQAGIPEWMMQTPPQMPGDVTPNAVTVDGSVSTTYQIQAHGAGDFSYTFVVHGSSGSGVSTTGLYTMGTAGVDEIDVFDGTGHKVGRITINAINPPFTPTDLPNLVAWYRADLGVHVTGGTNVTQWDDSSGNGNNLTLEAGQGSPTLRANINGKASIFFQPTAGKMNVAGGLAPALTTQGEVWSVQRNADDGVTRSSGFCLTGGAGSNNLQPFEAGAPTRQWYENALSTGRYATGFAPAAGAWANPYVLRVSATSGGAWLAEFNGTTVSTQVGNVFGAGTFQVGAGDVTLMTGDIAELIISSAPITGTDLTNLRAYLVARYGVS